MKSKRLKKILIRTLLVIVGIYILGCSYMYFFQESFMFHPTVLKQSHVFQFENEFDETAITTQDGTNLNAVHFKAEESKGLVFYLHGNGGNIQTCGDVAKSFTDLGYDLFMIDYRGFGKSEGEISSQDQLFSDVQLAYEKVKKEYGEENIVVLGYSMGSGLAAHLSSENKPRKLILEAPYYSMVDMMQFRYPIVPTFLLEYKLETNKYIKKCSMPIVIFHGDKDGVIPYNSSTRLIKLMKKEDQLIRLKGQKHKDIGDNETLLRNLPNILSH